MNACTTRRRSIRGQGHQSTDHAGVFNLWHMLPNVYLRTQHGHALCKAISEPLLSTFTTMLDFRTLAAEVGNMCLTPSKWKCRRREGWCFSCGGTDHLILQFCISQERRTSSERLSEGSLSARPSVVSTLPVFATPPFMLPAKVHLSDQCIVASAMINFGLAGNFLDQWTAQDYHLLLVDLHSLVKIRSIDGGPIGTRVITQFYPPAWD